MCDTVSFIVRRTGAFPMLGPGFGPGEDYEQIAPHQCGDCGAVRFDRRGRVGLWDGARGGGFIYEAMCLSCETVWRCNSDPLAARDNPSSMRWYKIGPRMS